MGQKPCRTVRRKAFQLAHQEAHRLNHPEVGIEHLLLGLAKEGLSPAASALYAAGYDLAFLREQIKRRYPAAQEKIPLPGALPYNAELEELLDNALVAGESSGVLPLTPELLLLILVERIGGIVDEDACNQIYWELISL